MKSAYQPPFCGHNCCYYLKSMRLLQVVPVCLLLLAQAAHAAEGERPRVGLVLSGGGARGAAHVGVLKVLDEMRVPVDAIAGTSMGAVVGGLYASGMTAAEIETLIRSLNWQDAFRDRPPREELGFRRKQDERNFLVRFALGVKETGFVLPPGLVQGQKLEQVLRNAALPVAEIQGFDRLPIPFRAIATDLETGQAVVMDSGDLVTAMRASMSAPGVFSPAQRDGRLLVDGGLVENLPIDTARAMGVDVLIVVDVSFPLYLRDELTSPLEVTNQAFAILIRGRTIEQRQKLLPTDIVLDPPLGRFPSTDFSRVPQALRAGEEAARGSSTSLAKLSLSEADYRNYLATRGARSTQLPVIEFVRADSTLRAVRPADPGDDARPGRQAARPGAGPPQAVIFVCARPLRNDRLPADRRRGACRPAAGPAPQELGSELRAHGTQPRRRLRGQQPLQRGAALHRDGAEQSRRRMAHRHPDRREPEALHRVLPAAVARQPLLRRAAVRLRGAQRVRAARSRPRRRVPRARSVGRNRRRPRDFQLGRDPLRRAPGHRAAARADRRSFAAERRVRSRRFFHAFLLRQARQYFLSAPRPAVRHRMARGARERRRRRATSTSCAPAGWSRARSIGIRSSSGPTPGPRSTRWKRPRTRSRSAAS